LKNINFLLLTIIFLILLISVNAQLVSHTASEITAGTFAAGDFSFPNNLAVIGNVNIETDDFAKLIIDSGNGAKPGFSAIDFYNNGNPIWGLGKNNDGNFYIDKSGDLIPAFFIDLTTKNIGIGTTSPSQRLTVNGLIESISGGIKFPDGTVQASASSASDTLQLVTDRGRTTNLNIQSPRFEDFNDPSFYVDPAGTSRFNTIDLGGILRSTWPSEGGGNSVMELRMIDYSLGFSAPGTCPGGWTQASYTSVYEHSGTLHTSNNVRVCYRTDTACQVMELKIAPALGFPAACPAGWTQAINDPTWGWGTEKAGDGSNRVRTCYRCP